MLLVTWVAAAPLANSSMPAVASAIRNSSLVSGIDEYMPEAVKGVYESMRESLNTSGMPDVFSGLDPTEARSVEPPDPELAASEVVVNAEDSVLKVHGSAPSCDRQIEGSSFVYEDDLVVTNAHVVAGTDEVQVESDGDLLDADVIVFEPEKDLAILSVPDLDAEPLPLEARDRRLGRRRDRPGLSGRRAVHRDGRARARGAGRHGPGHLRRRHGHARGLPAVRAHHRRQFGRPAAQPGR